MACKDTEKRKAWSKVYNKAYRTANKEKRKAYLEANKEKIAARHKAWYVDNKEKIAAYNKAYNATNKEKAAAYRTANKEKRAAWSKVYYKANPRLSWYRYIKSRFNLTPEQYDAMLIEQSGRCAMCDEPLFDGNHGSHIDHCHATGRVRGILHGKCNTNYVGIIESDPVKFDKALGYLARVNAPCQEVAA
jgi:hypothetical protein